MTPLSLFTGAVGSPSMRAATASLSAALFALPACAPGADDRPAASISPSVAGQVIRPAPRAALEGPPVTPALGNVAATPRYAFPRAETIAVGPSALRAPVRPAAARGGVTIRVGDDWQAAVEAAPPGTTFLIKAGTHRSQSVIPKDGDRFVGEAGAIMDGEGVVRYAFWKGEVPPGRVGVPSPVGVTIKGLIVTGYSSPHSRGAIDLQGTKGWTVEDCEVRYNNKSGIRVGNGAVVRRNHIHHNRQYGINGQGPNVLVERNEIAYNNYDNSNRSDWDAGGTKFSQTTHLVLRENFVHHNVGNGLWIDINNYNVLVEGNRVEDNARNGIFYEISYDGVIRNNVIRRNGFAMRAPMRGSGIAIVNSSNVQVYGNTLEGNRNGITANQDNRGSGRRGFYEVANLDVHDNAIIVEPGTPGLTGLQVRAGGSEYYTSKNNRFRNNKYQLPEGGKFLFWMDAARSEDEWRSLGLDATGSFTRRPRSAAGAAVPRE